MINYIVHRNICDIGCETTEQVWEEIGASWGWYEVSSPTGKDVSEFIPFNWRV